MSLAGALLLRLSACWCLLAVASGNPIPFGQIGSANTVLFLNGFHFVNGNMSRQMQANHHCAVVSNDFIQCVIYDSHFSPSRLMGIEYIVSAKVFATLPAEEKQLWHSHVYEVKSGSLIEPELPRTIDDTIMKTLLTTYGKTFHTWRWDQTDSAFPLGIPELVMGFTEDGQLNQTLLKLRDAQFRIDSNDVRAHRDGSIPQGEIDPGADSWKNGFSVQLRLGNATEN